MEIHLHRNPIHKTSDTPATILAAAIGQHAKQLDIVLLEQRQRPVIEQIRRCDRRLAVVQLGASDLGVGVDERLLVDAAHALQIVDVERVLGALIARMLALESPCASLLGLGFSSATTCASVSTRPSWALLASSALSRLFMVSRSWRSQTQRTPAGETVSPRFLNSLAMPTWPNGRPLDGQRDDGVLDILRRAVLQHRLLSANLLQGKLAAFVVEFLEAIKAVAAVAHNVR